MNRENDFYNLYKIEIGSNGRDSFRIKYKNTTIYDLLFVAEELIAHLAEKSFCDKKTILNLIQKNQRRLNESEWVFIK